MIGPPPAAAATTSASSHKPRQTALTFPITSRRSSDSLLRNFACDLWHTTSRYVAERGTNVSSFFFPVLVSTFLPLKHLAAVRLYAGLNHHHFRVLFYRSSLPLGPYLFWVLSNGYLFCCEDILRFVPYLLCVYVWEDRDLTWTDPAPLMGQSLRIGCFIGQSVNMP